jgi:hypothetical protein
MKHLPRVKRKSCWVIYMPTGKYTAFEITFSPDLKSGTLRRLKHSKDGETTRTIDRWRILK